MPEGFWIKCVYAFVQAPTREPAVEVKKQKTKNKKQNLFVARTMEMSRPDSYVKNACQKFLAVLQSSRAWMTIHFFFVSTNFVISVFLMQHMWNYGSLPSLWTFGRRFTFQTLYHAWDLSSAGVACSWNFGSARASLVGIGAVTENIKLKSKLFLTSITYYVCLRSVAFLLSIYL